MWQKKVISSLSEFEVKRPTEMRIQIWHEGECFFLQCGPGFQRAGWVARIAAQRFGAGGSWSTPDKDVHRPREYVPGRIFFYPDQGEVDAESTLMSLAENLSETEQELAFSIELRDKPAPGLPSLAAVGSEDSVIPPKNSKAAVSYQVKHSKGRITIRRTPPPAPPPHRGYTFAEVYELVDVSDLTEGTDIMQLHTLRNVMSNNFIALVDIFLHYARPTTHAPSQVSGQGFDSPEPGLAISMRSMALLVRTCRISSESCSFFEIQRASVRPIFLQPSSDEHEPYIRLYDADYSISAFFEAIIRIGHLKNYGLMALCDQVNKLISVQLLPYAAEDEEDWIREMMPRGGVQAAIGVTHRGAIRKFYTKWTKLDREGARSVSLKEFIGCLRASGSLDEELSPSAVRDCWLATISYDATSETVQEDDTKVEVSLSELEEIFIRCVIQKVKATEENIQGQTEAFFRKFNKANVQ